MRNHAQTCVILRKLLIICVETEIYCVFSIRVQHSSFIVLEQEEDKDVDTEDEDDLPQTLPLLLQPALPHQLPLSPPVASSSVTAVRDRDG
jgi:hypothetical protein